jgi:hypothetical protein
MADIYARFRVESIEASNIAEIHGHPLQNAKAIPAEHESHN